ncbi:MAG: transcriptional regulator, partial [Actinomycetota bacterium]|nr:transcriptional regulator [Actinomycetota bacterium]
DLISRYLRMIQLQRGDYNGRVLTIRDEDVRALARLFERDASRMRLRMDELGIRA